GCWRTTGSFRRFLFLRLAFLARNRLFRIVALCPLHDPGGVKKEHYALGRMCAFLHPGLDFFELELEPLGLFFRQQRIEVAEPLDEAAVARRPIVVDDDMINRPFFGAGTSETNNERHPLVLSHSN